MLVEHLQVRSKQIIHYNRYISDDPFSRSNKQKQAAENLKLQKTYTGVLCPGAKKRLTKALELLITGAKEKTVIKQNHHKIKFSVNFITFTIYSFGKKVPANEAAKNLLEPMLLWMKRKHGLKSYVWKAELQANRKDCKQLHYHLTTDTYIPWQEMRDKWNELQKNCGYLDTYFEKYGHYNPNSTDVHALYKIGDPVKYITKEVLNASDAIEKKYKAAIQKTIGKKDISDYTANDWNIVNEVTKTVQNQENVGGKVWDCSLNLKAGSYYETMQDQAVMDKIERQIEVENIIKVETDHCNIYKFKSGPAYQVLTERLKQEFFNNTNQIYNYQRQAPAIVSDPSPPQPPKPKINFYIDQTLFNKS